MKDNELIQKAINQNIEDVYDAADLIEEKHGIYRFNMMQDDAGELISDMVFASTGSKPSKHELDMGIVYLFIHEEEINEKTKEYELSR